MGTSLPTREKARKRANRCVLAVSVTQGESHALIGKPYPADTGYRSSGGIGELPSEAGGDT